MHVLQHAPYAWHTTGFGPFAEWEVTLVEKVFPLSEAFPKRKLSAMASRRYCTGEELFAESMWGPSRRKCVERPT
jgi:hypothetical protein